MESPDPGDGVQRNHQDEVILLAGVRVEGLLLLGIRVFFHCHCLSLQLLPAAGRR
jgi:hypothetical protein